MYHFLTWQIWKLSSFLVSDVTQWSSLGARRRVTWSTPTRRTPSRKTITNGKKTWKSVENFSVKTDIDISPIEFLALRSGECLSSAQCQQRTICNLYLTLNFFFNRQSCDVIIILLLVSNFVSGWFHSKTNYWIFYSTLSNWWKNSFI